MARVLEYYVEGEGRKWERGGSGRGDGVGEKREWERGWSRREEGVVEGKGVEE